MGTPPFAFQLTFSLLFLFAHSPGLPPPPPFSCSHNQEEPKLPRRLALADSLLLWQCVGDFRRHEAK
ncbi:hypothetical protein MA16_Dca020456 [Dendrobium catenatum]|uniref:Secreted protein n=1 Tax=Dendrobium catenatum TaxID=906689 RepID=A0A2I0VCF0_9ASPA|nr:hypothetical protein MA16_Dca020456 [Dendrobium catenatum]